MTEIDDTKPSLITFTAEPGAIVQEMPTAILRWNGSVLEQEWVVEEIGPHGNSTSIRKEWRRIPIARPNADDAGLPVYAVREPK